MYKINKIDAEMKKNMFKIRDKWIKHGCNTTPINKEKARKLINHIYKKLKLDPPILIKLPNPFYLEKANNILTKNNYLNDYLNGAGKNKTHNEIEDELYNKIIHKLKFEVNNDISDEKNTSYKNNNYYLYNYFDWIAFGEVFNKKLQYCSSLNQYYENAQHCHIFNPLEKICSISENPLKILKDEQKRLHNETGPALVYGGGFELYRWHGIKIYKEAILNPKSITAVQIMKEKNAEIRRALMNIMGQDKFISDLNLLPTHKDDFGWLYKKKIEEIDYAWVRVWNGTPEPNGTKKEYWLSVPPHCNTAHEAVSWTYGLDIKQYNPNIRT